MTDLPIYAVYVASVALCALPLVHILLRGKLKTYFVFFVFDAGFLGLNLLGSISHNIRTNVATNRFHLLLLACALGMFATYVLLLVFASSYQTGSRRVLLMVPDAREGAVLRRYVRAVFAAVCALSLLFYVVFAPPVILRVDLFGQWGALIQERWKVVYGVSSFNWFSIVFFEVPALIAMMVAALAHLYRAEGDEEEAQSWGRMQRVILPVAMFLSISFLHIIVLVYLFAALGMVALFFRGRIPVGVIARYSLPAAVGVFLLYSVKRGFSLSGEAIADIGGIVVHRTVEVYAWAGATIVWLFPDRQPYLEGASFINVFGAFRFEQVDLASMVYPYIYNDITGGAPVPAVFETYANFGWPGAAVTIFIICLLTVGVTILSWSQDIFLFCMSLFLTLKSLLLWQSALWFGMLEPSLIVGLLMLTGGYYAMRAARPRQVPVLLRPV
jgi:hypothetical protein